MGSQDAQLLFYTTKFNTLRFVTNAGKYNFRMRHCINPQSPEGYCLDSDELRIAMQESLGIPVYDVKRIEN